jgi:hypothetical protein
VFQNFLSKSHLTKALRLKPIIGSVKFSVAEAHHFDAAPAPCKNFDAASTALAPTLLYIAKQIF